MEREVEERVVRQVAYALELAACCYNTHNREERLLDS